MQVLHNKTTTTYVERTFNGHSTILIPPFQRLPGGTAGHQEDCYKEYEPLRCLSMEQNLKKGDVLFDVGVSDGWLSAIYAQFVGAENMCLFEPMWYQWANVKGVWDANKLPTPRSTFYGFVSDKTQLIPPQKLDTIDIEYKDGWPQSAFANEMREEMQFRSLVSTAHCIPQTTIDDFVKRTNIIPRGISIDVEGAEFLVLQGAINTMREHHPLIWLSLHDINGALTYDYHSSKEEVFGWLTAQGYEMQFLENYGDSHWLCK